MYSRTILLVILGVAMLGIFGFSQSAFAAPYVLSNGPGDGSLSVGVDGFGSFGSGIIGGDASDASYDPVGAGGPGDTTFQSAIAIRTGTSGSRTFLSSGPIENSGNLANPPVTGTATSGTSSFSFDGLSFTLTQTLTPLFTGGSQTGTTLTLA